MVNLKKNQHKDGSYDEWYKHEHGFAATAFTSIAYGYVFFFLAHKLPSNIKKLYSEVMHKAGDWLLRHDDLVKINHQMAGAAALALIGHNLQSKKYLNGAKIKYELGISLQKKEGWFQEVAGMDLGYCSVLLDYVMTYHLVTGDNRPIDKMSKLVDFMFPYLHPDGTISPGTLYLTNVLTNDFKALTCPVADISYVRKYDYTPSEWKMR